MPIEKHGHIFFSYAFDAQGYPKKLNNRQVAQELENEGLAWVHLDGNSAVSKSWLEREVSYLDHLVIDALFACETRPRIIEFENGMLVILRGINLNDHADLEEMVSIRLWIDSSRIISIQRNNFSASFELSKKFDANKKIRNSGEFLYNLIYEILSLISPTITSLNDKLDQLEDAVSENRHDNNLRESVTSIRKQVTVFKRYMMPQRDVLLQLQSSDNYWIDDWARRHFQENHDQISHIIEELDEAKERSQIVHDEISNAIADRLNKSMFKISLIASIFMPLGFIAGLFGMNVGGIPGSSNPFGFIAIASVMLIFVATSWMIFKKKRWI